MYRCRPDKNNLYPHQGGNYRTYANAVFVNKTIIVPTYKEQYDTTGLRIWRESMPGYNIVGVDCDAMIFLGGAVHCITKEVGVTDPLAISHRRLDDITDVNPPAYEVKATIRHRSGITSASVFYKTDPGATYQELPMALVSPVENLWTAAIPQQPGGSTVYYYIHATANSGKQIARPMPAPEGYFRSKSMSRPVPPTLQRKIPDSAMCSLIRRAQSPVSPRLARTTAPRRSN